MEHALLELLASLQDAAYGKNRTGALSKAQDQVDRLRLWNRLARDLKCISPKQYTYAVERMEEIVRQVGGWSQTTVRACGIRANSDPNGKGGLESMKMRAFLVWSMLVPIGARAQEDVAMDSRSESRDEFFVIGVGIRTKNSDEGDPQTSKIARVVKKFYSENVAAHIPNATNPSRVVALYSDYASDEKGEYSYMIGLEVKNLDSIPDGLVGKKVPAAQYRVFTTPKGAIPDIIIRAWKQIWAMNASQLGGSRAFSSDFEVYDERSRDPRAAQVEVWLAIKK